MSKLIYKKETIVPYNNKLYKFIESLEEITKPSEEVTETIDLTMDDSTCNEVIDLTNNDASDANEQLESETQRASPSLDGSSSPFFETFSPITSPDYNSNTPGYTYDLPPYSPYTEHINNESIEEPPQNVHECT